MLGEVRFSSSIPSAYESKVITVHLYCLIILWLTLILYTIYKQQSVYYHYFSALSSDNHNMSVMCSIPSGKTPIGFSIIHFTTGHNNNERFHNVVIG